MQDSKNRPDYNSHTLRGVWVVSGDPPTSRWLPTTPRGWAIPIRPLWPGLMMNTIVYAVLAWTLWSALRMPRAYRRRRRQKRNQCLACGYSRAGLAESAACPECGAAGGTLSHTEKH